MEKISREDYQARIDRLMEIYEGIARRATEVSTCRCPYKDRLNQCTAKFGCRNQRQSPTPQAAPQCAGDDKLDYRKAWETN